MEANKFLMDFIKMRQELRQKEAAKPQAKPTATLRPVPTPAGPSLATIIEDRPSKAQVIKYFEARRNEILAEAEDD